MTDMTNQKQNKSKISQHTCPWWILFSFDNPLRRLYQDPEKILTPLVSRGDRILDLGCGMGFLSLPAAALAGETGEVIAVDLQQRMLDGLHRKAVKADLQERIRLQRASRNSIGVTGPFDLALAFWMVHEVRERENFLAQIWDLLKLQGKLLVAEPYLHVSRKDFERTVQILKALGFAAIEAPEIGFSRVRLVKKV